MSSEYIINQVGNFTVVEFCVVSLMDPQVLDRIGQELYSLVDEQDRRWLILDFERVQFLSSQAIGIVLMLNKKLSTLKRSRLVLCGVGPRLMELIKITQLDRILTIKPTQSQALSVK